jgi:hypothetical protein
MAGEHAGAASFGGRPAAPPVDVAGPVLTAHACRYNPLPKSPHAPTLAYDRFQLPVLTAHLQSGDLTIVLAALTSLRRLCTTHDVVVKVVECNLHLVLAATIVAHLHSENVVLSRLALQCLLTVGKSPALRADVVCEPTVADALRQAIRAGDALCRSLAYDTLATAASSHTTAAGLLAAGFIADAIDRVATELAGASDDTGINLLCLALYLLRQLTRHGAGMPACVTAALESGGVPTLLHVCTTALAALPGVTSAETAHGWNTALHHACMVLLALTFPHEGKAALLGVEGSVATLAAVCGAATTMEVATAAVGALMVRGVGCMRCSGAVRDVCLGWRDRAAAAGSLGSAPSTTAALRGGPPAHLPARVRRPTSHGGPPCASTDPPPPPPFSPSATMLTPRSHTLIPPPPLRPRLPAQSVSLDDAAKPHAAASGVVDVLVSLVTGNAAAPEAGTLLSYACRTLAALHSHPAVGVALRGNADLRATLRAITAAGEGVGTVGSAAAGGVRGALVRAARDLLALVEKE